MRILVLSLVVISFLFGISNNNLTAVSSDNNIGIVKVEKDNRAVPQKMNLQGYITTSTGDTFTGTRSMIFKIYRGATEVWTETQASVNVQKSLFSVSLGNSNPISASVFEPGTTPCSLQVVVETQPLSPKIEITSSAFAFKSVKTDTASYAVVSAGAPPTGNAGGDLTGTYPNPSINNDAVTMAKISTVGSTSGQVITSNGSSNDPSWQNPTVGPHNHIGETWSSTSFDRGLTTIINRNSTQNIYGKFDSVNNTGTGYAYGGMFCATGTGAGDKYGVYGRAYNLEGTDEWAAGVTGYSYEAGTNGSSGGCFEIDGPGTGEHMGVFVNAQVPSGGTAYVTGVQALVTNRGNNTGYGGYFDVDRGSVGTGAAFGVHAGALSLTSSHVRGVDGSAYNNGTGPAYGGYFYGGGSGSGTKYGIYSEVGGSGSTKYAGYFNGNVQITGSLSKGSGSFLIDHPLDPLNQTLRHNFVESPENLCLYRGKVMLNINGEGKVTMPNYFIALTKETEATVTISVIGRPFNTGYEWNNDYSQFTVYGEPNREVSYIVLADRDDPVIHKLYRPVEQEKGNGNFEKGKLLYPEAYGYPKEMGNDYHPESEAPKSSNEHK